MKRRLAVMVAVVAMMASGWSEGKAAFVNHAAVTKAAMQVKAVAALASVTTVAGNLPIFTNTAGALGPSILYQSGNNIGIGTTTPTFNLQFVSTVDPAAVTVDGYGIVGINFIGRRAEGTLATPTALLADDNIMAMQGRGYTPGGFSTSSRAFMKFFAAENWSNTANGTYISLATTLKGTSTAVERMRILDSGNVGIGTIAPAHPLSVAGAIQSTAGGFVFPDNSTQITAAVSGIALTSPDGSVTVGGTPVSPTVTVNQAAVRGWIGPSGTLAKIPVVVANVQFTGGYGLGATQTIYTATADGFYRVSVYMNVATAGTCASSPCAGEQITVQWNDGISTTALGTTHCDLTAVCGQSFVTPVWVKSGQAISAFGQSYLSNPAPTGGTYNGYVLVEQL